jgi:hypothetical protein
VKTLAFVEKRGEAVSIMAVVFLLVECDLWTTMRKWLGSPTAP